MLKNLTEAERKTLIGWAILGIAIFIVVILLKDEIIGTRYKDKVVLDKEYKLVQDYNRYYTVAGAVNKYYSFLSSNDAEAVMKILEDYYVKDNEITKENVLERVKSSDIDISFTPGIMCKKTYSKATTSYYLVGEEIPTFIHEGDESTLIDTTGLTKRYYDVTLYEDQFAFSIKPITEKEYNNECNS